MPEYSNLGDSAPDMRRSSELIWIGLALGLAGIVAVVWALPSSRWKGNLHINTNEGKVRQTEAALLAYKTLNGIFPTQEQGIEALLSRPVGEPQPRRWSQFLRQETITDDWGRELQYRNPGRRSTSGYDVFSFGPDGVESPDDIGNW